MAIDRSAPEPSTPDRIEALSQAVYPSFAMLAAMQLDLFSCLRDGPAEAPAIARQLTVEESRLHPLLYALVVIGLLDESEGRFANSAEAARYLVRGSPDFMGDRHRLWSDVWQSVLRTADSIRTGGPQARHDFATMPDTELDAFFSGLHPNALAAGREFGRTHDLTNVGELVDVGGGSGGFALGLAGAHPGLRLTVVDLEPVTAVTRRFVESAPAGARVEIVAADVTAQPLAGRYDAAVLKNFIQVLSQEQAAGALCHVFDALNPGGTIYVTGHILEDSRRAPAESVLFNIVFINIYDAGRAYTRAEYVSLLEQAGFADIDFLEEDLVTARKPDYHVAS